MRNHMTGHLIGLRQEQPAAPPPDVALANRLVAANCGPVAFAALLGLRVLEIMQFFPHFPDRTFTASRDMLNALQGIGLHHIRSKAIPSFGLAQIHFTGAWSHHRGAGRWAATKSHWIASHQGWVYDVLNRDWMRDGQWCSQTLPRLLAAHPRSTGFSVLNAFELPTQRFDPLRQVPGFARRFSGSQQSPYGIFADCAPAELKDQPPKLI
jgi:hypothetical protein